MSRQLFPHQANSIEMMLECESRIEVETSSHLKFRSTYGILSNPIGSGKTLTMLSLLNNHPLTIDNCKTVIFGSSSVQVEIKEYLMDPENQTSGRLQEGMIGLIKAVERVQLGIPQCRYLPYQLVLCTKPLVNEWINEAGASGIPIRSIFTPTLANKLKTDRPEPHSIIVVYPELLQATIKSLMVQEDIPLIGGCVVFDRVILDDIHMANKWKRDEAYSILGLFTWFLSATPEVLENIYLVARLRNACSAFSSYGMLSPVAHMVKVDVNTYVEPPVIKNHYIVEPHWAANTLSDILTDEVKHMLNMGDYNGIRNHFKTLLGNDEDVCKPIHELVLETEIKELDRLKKSLERFIENDMNTDNVCEKIESQKRKIEGIRERIDIVKQEEAECPICMCDVERKYMSLTPCCYNMFCKDCISAELQVRKMCPTCRSPLKKTHLLNIMENGETISMTHIAEKVDKSKLQNKERNNTCYGAIEKIMSRDYKKKYIIFTETSESVSIYKKYLMTNPDIKLTTLSGRLSSMKKNIDSLREGLVNGMFLNSMSMEAGLNLQFVDEIILVGNCKNDRLKQAIGRVRRYPRTEPVIVNYVSEQEVTE